MRKFFKGTLISGAAAIILGGALAAAGLWMGAVPGAVVVTDDGLRYMGRHEIWWEIREEIGDWVEEIREHSPGYHWREGWHDDWEDWIDFD